MNLATILTDSAARAGVKHDIAAYKHLRRVWFVGELPKGPTGKILEREIEPPHSD